MKIKNKTIVYVFGNPLINMDNLPIKLLPDLEKEFPQINFLVSDPNENLKPKNKKIIIIDTVVGIDDVTIIDDIAELETSDIYSLHDFDLAFNLKLLSKIAKLDKVIIFGVPVKISYNNALIQLIQKIKLHADEL